MIPFETIILRLFLEGISTKFHQYTHSTGIKIVVVIYRQFQHAQDDLTGLANGTQIMRPVVWGQREARDLVIEAQEIIRRLVHRGSALPAFVYYEIANLGYVFLIFIEVMSFVLRARCNPFHHFSA